MASNKTVNNKLSANDFKIWILDDSVEDFNLFIEDFKKDSGLKNLPITVESFSDYGEYNRALASAIIKGEAPDLYMLNNNEKSIFLENAT
jgi:ABC-type glycerol-3-phosphate transport system substrate-binding protein